MLDPQGGDDAGRSAAQEGEHGPESATAGVPQQEPGPVAGEGPSSSGKPDDPGEPDEEAAAEDWASAASDEASPLEAPGGAGRDVGDDDGEDAGGGEAGEAGETGAGDGGEDAGEVAEDHAERLQQAEALKLEGNQLFGEGRFREAAAKYNEALDAAPPAGSGGDGAVDKQRAACFCNLAACSMKSSEWAAAVQHCGMALQLDEGYIKALMRRSQALEALDDQDHALGDARRVLQLEPGNAWAAATAARLEPIVAEKAEKLKAEMLGKLKDLGNTILGKFGMSLDNFKMEQDPGTGGYSVKFQQ